MDLQSPVPAQGGDGDAPNQSLRAKINHMTRGASPDPKSAFVNDIWPKLQNEYDNMRERVKEFCENALKHESIACQVTSRTKAVDSIQKSLDRREKARGEQNQFKSLSDIFKEIHDLVGLRIVLEFPDDMERAVGFIKESFREEKEPAIFRPDRQVGRFWKTWFGAYQTSNHRVSLKDGKCGTLSQFRGVMFEIQVTTFAEDLYNKLAHPLLYKGLSLTRQDEIVLDMAHGNALNFALSLVYFEDKLSKRASKIGGRDELVAVAEEIARYGARFRESLTKGASFDTSASPQGLLETLKIPPERYNSVDNLARWINEKMTGVLDEIHSSSQTIRDAVLSKLPIANDAAFDSYKDEHDARCHPNTRVDLRREIMTWADDPQGTGKSTISRTVAQSFADKEVLGASFFFKRGERDRGNLVVEEPAVAAYVKAAIDADLAVIHKPLKEQFEKLVLEPLGKLKGDPSRAKTFAKTLSSVRLRAFVTSRPELPIRLGFAKIEGDYYDLVLHKVVLPIIEHDIAVFLRSRFIEIRDDHNALYGSPEVVYTLVQMAVPLFIFAATLCRFIQESGCDPRQQLAQIDKLDATYRLVLDRLLIGSEAAKRSVVARFRAVVGSIVLLAEPLSIRSLARLLNILEDTVFHQLQPLYSVLRVPASTDLESPVRTFYLSFRDFLVDPDKANEQEKYLFWLLSTGDRLKKDVCRLRLPGTCRSEIEQKIIDTNLPPDFLKRHLLHWLEVLGLLGWISESISMVGDLLGLLDREESSSVLAFLSDVQRVIRNYCSIINISPLQVYYSAIFPTWLALPPKVQLDWDICRQTLEGHRHPVRSVAFSPDSKMLASALDDKMIKLWDAAIGAYTATLEVHRNSVISVVFSHNSKMLASASYDKTIKLWDTAIGSCIATLEAYSHQVRSVAFSYDSKILASVSLDKTIKLWDVATGSCTATLEGHCNWVRSIAFSHDLNTLASVSYDKTIKLWDVVAGSCTATLEGHRHSVDSVVFSHDSKMLASASLDKTIKLWDIVTGACTATLEGYSNWNIKRLTFDIAGSCLHTNVGTFTLSHLSLSPTALSATTSPPPISMATLGSLLEGVDRRAPGLSEDNAWISWNSHKVLWLPPTYRPGESDTIGSTIAIGCPSGQVFFFRFSPNHLLLI
ncbi:hypothetical protein C8A01DRAFT_45879 [Parachaetomium inaequale]|uniref:Mitochondrial division protein 1 n=1 Tax=Parachaetomium inaequale TaxID=2588326 RepID=A0AAN6PKN3_9PEZI|nr:hypothetical protein C8A01DRAFT_45879 [Parachaetomium inaequale]